MHRGTLMQVSSSDHIVDFTSSDEGTLGFPRHAPPTFWQATQTCPFQTNLDLALSLLNASILHASLLFRR